MKVTESYRKFSFIRFLPILRSDTTKLFIMSNTDRPNSKKLYVEM